MRRTSYLLVLLALVLFVSPASAYSPGQFWAGFLKFWGNLFSSLGGVVGLALGCGVLGIFIITRGKWLK